MKIGILELPDNKKLSYWYNYGYDYDIFLTLKPKILIGDISASVLHSDRGALRNVFKLLQLQHGLKFHIPYTVVTLNTFYFEKQTLFTFRLLSNNGFFVANIDI